MSGSTEKALETKEARDPDDANNIGTGAPLPQVHQKLQRPDAKDLMERPTNETQSQLQKQALPPGAGERPLDQESHSEKKKGAPCKSSSRTTTASTTAASSKGGSASGQDNNSSPIAAAPSKKGAGVPALKASDSSNASVSSLSGEDKREEPLARPKRSKKNRRSKDGSVKLLSTNANQTNNQVSSTRQLFLSEPPLFCWFLL